MEVTTFNLSTFQWQIILSCEKENYSNVLSVGVTFYMFILVKKRPFYKFYALHESAIFALEFERQLGLVSCKISSEGCSRSMGISTLSLYNLRCMIRKICFLRVFFWITIYIKTFFLDNSFIIDQYHMKIYRNCCIALLFSENSYKTLKLCLS